MISVSARRINNFGESTRTLLPMTTFCCLLCQWSLKSTTSDLRTVANFWLCYWPKMNLSVALLRQMHRLSITSFMDVPMPKKNIWNFRPTIYADVIFRDAWIRCKQKFGNVYDLCPIVKQWLQNGKVNLPVSYDEIPIWAGQIVGKIFHLASPTYWLFRWKAVCSYTIAGWLFGWPTESSHSFTVSGNFLDFRTTFALS